MRVRRALMCPWRAPALLAAFDLFWGFLLHPAKLWSLFTGGAGGL